MEGSIMKKLFSIVMPVIILILSLLIMLSGSFLKKPRGDYDNVIKNIDTTTKAVLSEDWKLANQNTQKLDSSWKIVVKRIQFSSERTEINNISLSIARLKASIIAKDKSSALIELNSAKEHWEDLGK